MKDENFHHHVARQFDLSDAAFVPANVRHINLLAFAHGTDESR